MKETPPHVAILPSPGVDHFIPILEFAKRLTLQHNLSRTLIIPDSGPHMHEQKIFLEKIPRAMNYILLPPPDFDAFEADLKFELRTVFTIARSVQSIRDVIKSLIATKNLVALVVDLFGTPAFDVAKEFNISPFMFFPSTAMALSSFFYVTKLHATVSCEYRDLPEPIQIPGCIPVHGKDLPDPVQDRRSIGYQFFLNDVKRYQMAEGIMVNTFNDMEAGAINALREKQLQNPPIYPVGPLVQTDTFFNTRENDRDSEECMKWLDDQRRGSILFICFGSLGLLSHAQIHELALGLEMSEKGFLWVVRCPNDNEIFTTESDQRTPFDFLPEGFVERTNGRGLLVSNWAPQAMVLNHASTGGFLTHCGWNSVLESVVNGVPMIAWPLYAEQKMNAEMLSKDLKIALRPEANGNDWLVGRVAIANIVKNLMEGEAGKQLRKRTRDLMDAATLVLGEDGSSTKSMADFACKWKNKI